MPTHHPNTPPPHHPITPSPVTAHAITIKLWVADNNWGSGILIDRQSMRGGYRYTVLTNRHVVNAGTHHRIQTHDGQIHEGRVLEGPGLGDRDLALTQFTSPIHYEYARVAMAAVEVGDRVVAAGYPIEDDPSQSAGFTTVSGEVAQVLSQSMAGGYRIGAEIPVAKGMSGGPLLNENGEVVGINGMHQYPLWGNPYVFDDGSLPSEAARSEFQHYSWSISILDFGFWILD